MSDVARPQAAASSARDVDVSGSWSLVSDAYTDARIPTASPGPPPQQAVSSQRRPSKDTPRRRSRGHDSSAHGSQIPLTHPERTPLVLSDDPAAYEMQQLQFSERHFDTAAPLDSGVAISQSQNERLSRSLDLDYAGQNFDEVDSADTAQCNHHSFDYVRGHTRSSSSGGDRRLFDNLLSNGGGSDSDLEPDQSDKIKNKLMSAWNNMRHGWTVRVKTNFKYDHPIWLLGICYHPRRETDKEKRRCSQTSLEKFKQDFTSRLWFTYRQDFPAIEGTQITSDTGWGCMLRSGQMMISQALILHFLGRDWMWYPEQQPHQQSLHQQIVRYFADSCDAPFSIHKLVRIGQEMGKKPGDWYGPASVAYSLRDAMEQAAESNPLLGQLTLYVAQDCTVYIQDVIDLCTTVGSSSRRPSVQSNASASSDVAVDALMSLPPVDTWKPVIILIPVRLGGETLNEIYVPCLKTLLSTELCLGIIGGKPKHSLYYIGYQDEKLINLDPHFCQDYVDLRRSDPVVLQSYHCMSPRKMSFSKMDPSCTVGFYCKNRSEFDTFVLESKKIVAPPNEKNLYPMYVFADGRSIDVTYEGESKQERYLRVSHFDKMGRLKQPGKDSDDFVFL